ncbi:MAG: hypothetical protein ACMUEK_02965 [Sodalis sp. (in: enterobacteria)]
MIAPKQDMCAKTSIKISAYNVYIKSISIKLLRNLEKVTLFGISAVEFKSATFDLNLSLLPV